MPGGAGFLNHQQCGDKDEIVIGQSGFPTVSMFIHVYHPGAAFRGNSLSTYVTYLYIHIHGRVAVLLFWLVFMRDHIVWVEFPVEGKQKTLIPWFHSILLVFSSRCRQLCQKTCRFVCLPKFLIFFWGQCLLKIWMLLGCPVFMQTHTSGPPNPAWKMVRMGMLNNINM